MSSEKTPNIEQLKSLKCGIIMPISPIENCTKEHWTEVKNILFDAIKDADFEPNLVSDADDSGVIQKRIVQNIYQNEMIVCDVSCKNANVMFELGMRLAFDKPTIIVMDNMTQYSFDTAPIEHLSYPRDLSYFKIMDFKKQLADKIKGTYDAAQRSDYTTFLKNFGEFKTAAINPKEVNFQEFMASRLDELSSEIKDLRISQKSNIMRSVEEDILFRLVRDYIDMFCRETNTSFDSLIGTTEDSDIRQELFASLSKNKVIRKLCGSPDVLRKTINSAIPPF